MPQTNAEQSADHAGARDRSHRRVTIQDVAATAGVSVSAVSKVVRDAYGVSPQMRERVTSAIEQLGYRPNAGARAMRGRSYTIGVVVTELTSPFQPEVVEGVRHELEPTPYQEVLVVGGLSSDRQKRSIEALIDRQVDGLILVAPFVDGEWIERLAERVPLVAVALHGAPRAFDTVVDDDHLGARLMVDHLVALGHRQIAHTSMPTTGAGQRAFQLSHMVRREGYEAAMRDHGLEPRVALSSYSEEGGHRAALELLDEPLPPTAIFAGADIAALGAIRAAEDRRLRVPEDLTVVGYDNTYLSSINRISLTTVDQSGAMTGAVSARLLLERIGGRRQPVRYVVTPTLIERATSTFPVPPRDGTPPAHGAG